jgi:AcrR family transcriptional regulator
MLCNTVKVSPRRLDPAIAAALVDRAARLLAEEGAQSLTTRRIAAEVGTSTMAVYTYFGGMSGLVREMVREGFARLHRRFGQVGRTGDPVADMATYGRAYRYNALANSHLYAAMFGGSSLAGFELTDEDRQYGRYTIADVVDCARRCVETGRFRPADADLVANSMWISTHGLVVLELGGYLVEPWDADRCFEAQLVAMMVGAGDTLEAATRSVAASADRFPREVSRSDGEPAPADA